MTASRLDPAFLRAESARLRGARPEAVLAWALGTFPGRAAVTVSFGGPGVALAVMARAIDPDAPIIFLDTGMLFPETYALRDAMVARYGLRVVEYAPATDVGALYETDVDGCCAVRKVEPMRRALADHDAWVSAVRRDQGATRALTEVIEPHVVDGRPLAKVHPLAHWSRADVWRYLLDRDIPYNPLLDRGYASLGCWPCTRATAAGEDERAGRWAGTGKTECGLHTFTSAAPIAAPEGVP